MTTFANTGAIAAGTTTANKGKRAMFVSLAAIAVIVGMTVGSDFSQVDRTHFASAFATEPAQMSEFPSEAWEGMTAPASRKVRCIMPPAWRRDCPADNR